MTIVAQEETRNVAWSSDKTLFGQRMLLKMGWEHGKGLGRNQQGTCTNLRAIRREDGLGIGANTDAFGQDGFSTTCRNFHSLLASLKPEHGESDESEEAKKERKKKKKRQKKRKKREETSEDEGDKSVITLATNRVSAGHTRKMLESKNLTKKSKEDMAAIFGVKVSTYESSSIWGKLSSSTEPGTSSPELSGKESETLTNDVSKNKNKIQGEGAKIEKKTSKKRKRKDRELDGAKLTKKR